jgi:hypothetical protein
MRLKAKTLVRMAVWLLLLALPTMIFWSPAAQAAGGSLQIRLQPEDGSQYPPGDLVLSDPSARMTGSDSRANDNFQEIPGATYSAENISAGRQAFRLSVDNAVSGTYSLRVIGVDSGRYLLSMDGSDQAGNHAKLRFTAGLQPGEVHHYVIHYSNRGGASLRARRTQAAE